MFSIYVTCYKIFEDRWGHVIHVDAGTIFNGLQIDEPMEAVRLFHELPDNSVMLVWDERDNKYRFSKGTLLESKEDSNIDLFTWNYV